MSDSSSLGSSSSNSSSSTRASFGRVCELCYRRAPWDLLLLTESVKCRSAAEHSRPRYVLVAEHKGVLVRIRQLPLVYQTHLKLPLRSRPSPRYFRRCYMAGLGCPGVVDCYWPHSKAEKRAWKSFSLHCSKGLHSEKNASLKDISNSPHLPSDMTLPINLENYKTKYKSLLFHEEEEHKNIIDEVLNRMEKTYIIVTYRPRQIAQDNFALSAFVESLDSSQMAYATQMRNQLTIMSTNSCIICEAVYGYKFSQDVLSISFDSENAAKFMKFYPKTQFKIKFKVNRSLFENLHNVLTCITDDALKRIIPSPDDFVPFSLEHLEIDTNLNEDQMYGLKLILHTKSQAPILIHGPSGCGKTHLLSVAAKFIIKDESITRILLSCHHHCSADRILKEYFLDMPSDATVVRIIKEKCCSSALNEFQFNISDCSKISFFNRFSKEAKLIVVTAYDTALKISNVAPTGFFTHIFIDEGGQAREIDTLAPLLLANKDTHLVIAGGLHQAGPKISVTGDEPQEYGLGESLFQRLYLHYLELGEVAKKFIVLLRCNYQCHKDILKLSSHIFYESRLVSSCSLAMTDSYPLKFVCSSFRDLSSMSFYESFLMLDEVKKVLNNKIYPLNEFCVISASFNQIAEIKSIICNDENYSCLKGLNVCGINDIPNQRYTLLFMSTHEYLDDSYQPVNVLKSFCHPAVFHTAITKSKCLVVAVGNPLVLMMCEATVDKPMWCWKEFINKCIINGTFVVPEFLTQAFPCIENSFCNFLITQNCSEIMKLFWRVMLTPEYSSIDCDEMELDYAVTNAITQYQAVDCSTKQEDEDEWPLLGNCDIELAASKKATGVNENKSFSSTRCNDACYIPSTVHSHSINQLTTTVMPSNCTLRNDRNMPSNSVTLLSDSSKNASTGTGCSMSKEDFISMSSSSVSPSDVSNNFESSCMPMKTRMMKPLLEVAETLQQFCFQIVLCTIMCVILLSIFLRNLFQLTSNLTSRPRFDLSVSSGCDIDSGTHSTATSLATNSSQVPSNLSFLSKSAIPLKSDISSSKALDSSKRKSSLKCKKESKKKSGVAQEKMPSNPKPSSNQSSNQSVSSDCKSTHNSGTLKTSSSRSTHLFPVHSNILQSSDSLKLLVSSEINSSHGQKKKRKKKDVVSQEIIPNNPRPLSADPKTVLQCPDIRTSVSITPHPVVKVPKLSQQVKCNDKRNSRSRNFDGETHRKQFTLGEASPPLCDQKKGRANIENEGVIAEVENSFDQVSFDEALLDVPLTRENYKKKFQLLLKLEEEEHYRLLKERCDGEYNVKIFKPGFVPYLKYNKNPAHVRYGLLHGVNLNGNVVSHIKQASSETENVRLHYPSGVIVKAEVVNGYHLWKNESLIIAFTNSELSKVIKEMEKLQEHEGDFSDVAISFVLKRWYFDRLHKALENLSSATINRLIPACASDFTNSDDKPNLSQPANLLNSIIKLDEGSFNLQMEALKLIMGCQAGKAPVLVIGSFGTGKTRLLARAAYQILRNNPSNRVLICTHHQHCADTFITSYFLKMKNCGWNVHAVRLVPSKLQYRMPPDCQNFYEDVRDFNFNKRDHRLIVTTFSTSFNLLHRDHNVQKGCFSHILLDEGAQAREPESIIPLCLADNNTKIIIAGDHKQVGPSLIVLGEAAIDNGLSVSLLERLHRVYEKSDASANYCATLLTNYRCHPTILSLPSYLFYNSMLFASATATTFRSPASLGYPFHFICTNLSEEYEVHNSTSKTEVDLLLKEVTKYLDCGEQSQRNLKDICIMASTPNQRSMFLKQISSKNEHSSNAGADSIEVLTVDMIQGREFEAVFLSTAEPTTAAGKSFTPTKTPCSPFVFNTVLTRAKSFVVCAGNPFLLLTMEKLMNKEALCWKEYIKRCIVFKTFIIPDVAACAQRDGIIDKLQNIIFPEVAEEDVKFEDDVIDSIMNSYKKVFQRKRQSKKHKIKLDETMRWETIGGDEEIEIANDDKMPVSSVAIECKLQVSTNQIVEAIPCKGLERKPIRLVHNAHRRCAFDGDIVHVKTFQEKQSCGKVASIAKPRHQLRFVCRSLPFSHIRFYPLDKSVPSIVNLIPKIIISYYEQNVRENRFIPIFSSSSLHLLKDMDNDELPKIKELISHELADDLLFVVQILGWSPNYNQPLGAVIEALPRTSNLFFTERLLKITYDIHKVMPDDVYPEPIPIDDGLCHYGLAFTIDSPNTINMDDALSLTCSIEPDTYELAVHISNVASAISKGSTLDIEAKKKGKSVHAMHMLPTPNSFSLNTNTTHSVLTISAKVVVRNGEIDNIDCSVGTDGPRKASIISQARLTYEAAQNLLDNKPLQNTSLEGQVREFNRQAALTNGTRPGLDMEDTLCLLYKIAKKLHEDRLGKFSFDEKVDREIWQAKFLISELMVWANSKIADYLVRHLGHENMALVRRQLPPLPEKLEKFKELFSSSYPYLFPLEPPAETPQPFIMTNISLSLLHSAYLSSNHKLLLWVLSNNFLYPQLARAHSVAKQINQPAEYIAKIDPDDDPIISRSHYNLKLPAYAHFTSPIRRYFDLLVHRIVIALMEGSDINYSSEELEEICQMLNQRTKVTQKVDHTLDRAEETRKCERSLSEYQGFLAKCYSEKKPGRFQLIISEQDKFNEIDTTFEYSFLNICSYERIEEPAWRFISATLSGRVSISGNITQFIESKESDQACVSFDENSLAESPSLTMESASSDENDSVESFPKDFCHINAVAFEYLPSNTENKNEQQMKYATYKASVPSKMHEIDFQLWKEMQDYVKTESSDSITSVMQKLPKLNSNDETCTQPQSLLDSPVVIFDVKRSFNPGEELTVKIGKSLRDLFPTPCLQLMEIAPGFQVCLQHNRHPSLSFSDSQLSQASKEDYDSMKHYFKLWSKVMVAEAASEGVRNSHKNNVCFLKNVNLKWPQFNLVNNLVDVEHYEPAIDGEISFVIDENKLDILNYIHISVGYFVCARYEVTDKQWQAVYHFVVTDMKSKEDSKGVKSPLTISMKSMGSPCWIPRNVKDHLSSFLCDLQIIEMQVSFTRVFKRLTSCESWPKLAKDIAVGNYQLSKLKNNDTVWLRNDPFALKLWSDESVDLNKEQVEAIEFAMKHNFSLIQGPPGTGKSVVGAHLAYAFSKTNAKLVNKSVLYCCPSNKAVDVVHKKLRKLNIKLEKLNHKKLKLIRLYGRTHERHDYPNPFHNLSQFDTKIPKHVEGRCLHELKEDSLHFKIREENEEIKKMRSKFLELFNKKIIASLTERNSYKNLIMEAEEKVLSDEYDIILCTCNESSSERLLNLAKSSRISHCIIDECGMAQEPETIAAASLCDHVVLIGDHMQLQPIINFHPARENGLSKSLFERYAIRPRFERYLIQLKTQYRMHKTICDPPSNLFYCDMLKTDPSVGKNPPPWLSSMTTFWQNDCRIAVYDIKGKEDDDLLSSEQPFSGKFDIHSKINKREAEVVLDVIKMLHNKYGVPFSSIAVLTPYAGQKELLKTMIEEDSAMKNVLTEIKVTTIVESQGAEHDIVILTTVRTLPHDEIKDDRFVQNDRKWRMENIGFLTDTNQMNVGITRAKHGLIVIGNTTLLKYVKEWRDFFNLYNHSTIQEITL